MDEFFKQRDILFLPGLHFSNFTTLEDEFNKFLVDMIDESVDVAANVVLYDKIQDIYQKSTWSQTTNLKCWNCDCTFNTRPIFIPSHVWTDGDIVFANVDVENGGNFCHYNCAYTWIKKEYPKYQHVGRISMLRMILIDLFGEDYLISFKEVSPKTSRIEYGGRDTIEEYKSKMTCDIITSDIL